MAAWREEFATAYPSDWGPDWTEAYNDGGDVYSVAGGLGLLPVDAESYLELYKDAPDVLDATHWRLTSRFRIPTIPKRGAWTLLDRFTRVEGGGLGVASNGSAWTKVFGGGGATVDGSRAVFVTDAGTPNDQVSYDVPLATEVAQPLRWKGVFEPSVVPTSGTQRLTFLMTVWSEDPPGTKHFLARLTARVANHGGLFGGEVSVQSDWGTGGGSSQNKTDWDTIPYNVLLEVVPRSVVRAKVWPVGAEEPAAWLVSQAQTGAASDAETQATALQLTLAQAAPAPVTGYFDDLYTSTGPDDQGYVELGWLPGGWDGPACWIDAYRSPGGPSVLATYTLSDGYAEVELPTWQKNVSYQLEIDRKAGRSTEYRVWPSTSSRPAAPMIEDPLGPFAAARDEFDRTVAPGDVDGHGWWPKPGPVVRQYEGYGLSVGDGFGKLEFPPSLGIGPQVVIGGYGDDVGAYGPNTTKLLCQFSPAFPDDIDASIEFGAGTASWYPDGSLRLSTHPGPNTGFDPGLEYATGLDMHLPTWIEAEHTMAATRMRAWQGDEDAAPAWQLELTEDLGPAVDLIVGIRAYFETALPGGGGLWVDTLIFDAPEWGTASDLMPTVGIETYATDGPAGSEVDWVRIDALPTFDDVDPASCDSAMLFDVYDIGNALFPELTYLGTLCSAFEKQIIVEADGTGSGQFRINRYADPKTGAPNPEVSASILGAGIAGTPRLVKVRIPEIDDEPVFAFFLESGDFKLIDPAERGGEILTFGGPGILSYIGWGVMDAASYLTEPFVGEQPYDQTWHLYADSSITTVLLAYAANGTDDVLSSWPLPSINPPGDDVQLVTFYQVRPVASVSASGWTARVHADTSGLDGGTGFGEFRYGMLDREVDSGSPPYADTLASSIPTRWSAAQVALRRVTGSSPVQAAGHWSAGGGAKAATLPDPVTPGNALLAYATFTSGASGTPVFDWPDGWVEILSIPGQNSFLGVASVAYKEADGSEDGVELTMTDDPASVTGGTVLVAEYPLVPIVLQPAGAILWRIIREMQLEARPSRPIPLLSMDFDYMVDSTGTAWQPTPATAQFQAKVGENSMGVVGRLLGTGAVGVRMDPNFGLHAYNRDAFGADRTGAAFAEGVVRFERGVNIASAARSILTGQLVTHDLVQGNGDTYGRAVIADADDKPHREGFVAAGSQDDVAALNDIGAADLLERLRHTESLPMPVVVGDDPLSGRYLPFKHFQPGDYVSTTTGEGDQDYQDAAFQIASIIVRDGAASSRAADLRVILELGSTIQAPSSPSGGGSYGGGITSGSGGGSGAVPVHQHNGASHSGQLPHTTLSDVLPDQHHDEAHAHDGADGSGTVAHSNLTGVSADQHHTRDHAARHADGGADEVPVEGLPTAATITTQVLSPDGAGGVVFRDEATGGAGTPADTVADETAFGIAPDPGADTEYSRGTHTHGTPDDPVPAHEAALDPHPGYLTEAEGDAAYDALGAAASVGGALLAHLGDTADAHDASATSVAPAGDISSTDVQAALEELDAEKQPLDSDLTAIAALSTTAFGRALLELADAAAGRTALGLGTAATHATGDYDAAGAAAAAQAASQPLDSDLTAIAALTTTGFGRAFLELANAGAGRTYLGLGTAATSNTGDFDAAGAAAAAQTASQPLDSDLTALAALSTTAYGRSLLEAANAAGARTLLGLGTAATSSAGDFDAAGAAAAAQAASQPLDSDLTAIAALAPSNDDVVQRKAGAWTNRTMAQLIADLAALGTTFQPLDSDLTAVAAVATTAYGRGYLALADAAAGRTYLGLGTAATSASTDFQPIDADLTAIAALSTTAFGRSLLAAADATALRVLAGVVIGTDVQAFDAELAAIAGLVSAADQAPYFTGSGTAALATLTAAGRALIDDADAAAQRTTLGLGGLAVLSSLAHSATTGQTANDHHAQLHAAAHAENAADELLVEALGTASTDTTKVFGPDGAGGVTLVTPSSGDLAKTDTTPAGNETIGADEIATLPGDAIYSIAVGNVLSIAATGRLSFCAGAYDPTAHGVLVPWSGSSATKPNGYLVADGSLGTPDLSDSFIAGSSAGPTSGGTISPTAALATHATHADHASHTHTGSADHAAHTHAGPSHTHEVVGLGFTAAGTGIFLAGSSTGSNLTITRAVSTVVSSGTAPQAVTTASGTGNTGNPSATLTHGITGGPSATLTHDAHDAHGIYKYWAFVWLYRN